MPPRIQQRLVLSLLTVAAVPLLGVGLYTIHSHTEALTRLATSSARERVELKARKVEALLGELRSDLVFLARSPVMLGLFVDADPAARRQRLGQQLLSFTVAKPVFAHLFYLDEEGDEIVGARNDGQRSWLVPPDDLRRRSLSTAFRAVMAQTPGEVFVEALDRDAAEAREPVVRYAVRVADRSDRRRGVLVADLFARRIVDFVRDEQSYTWLLDAVGWTVSPSAEPPPRTRTDELAEIRDRLAGTQTSVEAVAGGSVAWTLVHPLAPGAAPEWLLTEWVPESEAFGLVRRFRLVFGALVVVVVIAAVGLSLVLARRISDPLDALAEGARRLAGGDLTHRLDVRTGDEIEQLAAEFNRMGAALQDSYARLAQREADKSEKLEQVSRQLLESERLAAVGQLAAGVAHEVNNPVAVVSMYVEQLLETEGLSAEQRDKLHIIERHAERLGRITRGLLDFARVREYRQDRFAAASPVRRALEALAPQLAEARIEAKLQAVPDAGCVVGDEEQLQQVCENLILNAMHASPGGHIDVMVRPEGDGRVEIVVSDDGSGIDEAHLARVFEPFFTTKEVGEGTGLGLSISYGIVKAHRGRMSVSSPPQGGATFTVSLPLAPREEEG